MEDKILQTATLAGRSLLESGAETHRVEDTIVRICNQYQLENTHCFSTLTGIMVSGEKNGKNYAIVTRVTSRSTNLQKIVDINALSRNACNLTIQEFEEKLHQILKHPSATLLQNVLFGFLACFGFNLLFEGCLMDSFYAGVFGAVIRYLTIKLNDYNINAFFSITSLAALATFMALICNQFNLLENYNTTIIATIMLLVPGLAITNAIYDSLAGDLVSGTTRAIEAIIIAISIALGSGTATYVWKYLFEDIYFVESITQLPLIYTFIGAFLSTYSFAVLFNSKKENVTLSAIGGTMGFIMYTFIVKNYGNVNLALFIAAMTFSLYSEFSARKFKAPSIVFLIPALILLVPGSGMYYTMLYAVNGMPSQSLWTGLDTFAMAISIAFGVIFASTFAKLYFKIKQKRKQKSTT
ncbi:MAG: threonine/serine exporter family protein [Erysipelotrichaceae bacterium]